MVKVLFPSLLMKATGEKETEVPARTIGEVIDGLVEKYGDPLREIIFEESGVLNRYLKFYIKGRRASRYDTLGTRLKDGDEVAILVIIGGG